MLQTSDPAPLDIVLRDERGDEFTLRDLLGSWVVVYFYPKDNTPGCTVEAEGFEAQQEAFKKIGARVIGVSKDSPASHQRFIEKKNLTFTLVADEQHTLMEAFGTWGERTFMGRTYLGTTRSTFLIDPRGRIDFVWDKVRPAGHAEEVLTLVQKRQVGSMRIT